MKKIIFILFSILSTLPGCQSKTPSVADIIGSWSSKEGGEISFNNDGTFESKSLPTEIFIWNSKENSKEFDGYGKWTIEKVESIWKINLYIRETSINVKNYAQRLLIARGKWYFRK